MGETFAADFGVAEDGTVRSLDYKADCGMLASHIGDTSQGRMEFSSVTVAGILGSPGNVLHGGCRVNRHGREHGI